MSVIVCDPNELIRLFKSFEEIFVRHVMKIKKINTDVLDDLTTQEEQNNFVDNIKKENRSLLIQSIQQKHIAFSSYSCLREELEIARFLSGKEFHINTEEEQSLIKYLIKVVKRGSFE